MKIVSIVGARPQFIKCTLVSHEPRKEHEEVNRILTDKMSDLLFCPAQTVVDNLAKEGIAGGTWCVSDGCSDGRLSSVQSEGY